MTESSGVVELLDQLIRIPSVNPILVPSPESGELAIATFARDWLEQHNVTAQLEEVAPGRPNAVGQVGRDGGPTLTLCAHIDTVATSGMSIAPFEPKVADGRMFGRGSYDMKGGVAAVMAAAAELAKRDLKGKVFVALVVDEEHASIGAQHFVDHHPSDACILTEPSEGDLILAHKGFVWGEVRCTGRAAHGSRWDLGDSAISKMAPIVTALSEFDKSDLRSRTHPLVGPASMHCGVVEGGSGISTYAAECRLEIERRTLPNETNDVAFREIVDVIHECDPEADVRMLLTRDPMVTRPDAAVANATREAIRQVTGAAARETGVAYWMDAAIFSAAGMDTVNYGPTGAGAHEAEEWVEIQSVIDCARVLVEAATRFVGSS